MRPAKNDSKQDKNLSQLSMQATPWLELTESQATRNNHKAPPNRHLTWLNLLAISLLIFAGCVLAYKFENQLPEHIQQKMGLMGSVFSDPFANVSSHLAAPDPEATKTDLRPEDKILSRYVGGMTSADLAADFEGLVNLAQAGDAKLAFALSQRLQDCTLSTLQTAANVKTRREKAYSELSQQELCGNLTGAQLSMADKLTNIALTAKYPEAMLMKVLDGLDTLDAEIKRYTYQNPGATMLPDNSKQLDEYISQLTSLAQTGNFKALATLADIYIKAESVVPDSVKQLAYQLIVDADWQKGSAQFEKNPILEDQTTFVKTKALEEAKRLYDSCCLNKKKFSSGVDF